MAQIFDPLPPDQVSQILCCYINATSKIQISRISNIPNWYFERVVFPGQRLVFEAPPQAVLEIHTGTVASAILSDNIPCDRLCIDEESDFSAQPIDRQELDSKKIMQQFTRANRLMTTNLMTNTLTTVD
jgi:hypothetical protein